MGLLLEKPLLKRGSLSFFLCCTLIFLRSFSRTNERTKFSVLLPTCDILTFNVRSPVGRSVGNGGNGGGAEFPNPLMHER